MISIKTDMTELADSDTNSFILFHKRTIILLGPQQQELFIRKSNTKRIPFSEG